MFQSLNTAILYYRVGKNMSLANMYSMLRWKYLSDIRKVETPWIIILGITYRCQCSCSHCSAGAGREGDKYKIEAPKELTLEEIKGILDQASEMGIPKIDLFGGEPLIREDIVDIVAHGAKRGLYMAITTNGEYLTKDLTVALKKAGVNCINISLDSTSERVHDRLRGRAGLYKKVVAGIKDCYELGVPCIVSTCVTRKRVASNDFKEMIALSRDLKASAVRILFPSQAGRWNENKEIILSDAEQVAVIDSLDSSFCFIEGAFSVECKKKVCQALRKKMLYISPYGDVQVCVAINKSFGNVRNCSLQEAIKGMWSHPSFVKNKDCCAAGEFIYS